MYSTRYMLHDEILIKSPKCAEYRVTERAFPEITMFITGHPLLDKLVVTDKFSVPLNSLN